MPKRQRGGANDDTIHKTRSCDVNPEKCDGDDPETINSSSDNAETIHSSSEDEQTDKGATPKTLTAEELAQVRENIRARQKAGMVRVTTLWLQDVEQDRRLVWYV